MRKPMIAGLLALAMFALTGGGAALAHECFNTSRSEQGNAGAAHSPNWETLTLEDLAADIGLTPAETADFLEQAEDADIPFSFTIFVGKHTIGENGIGFLDGDKAVDGQGIDWFFRKYGQSLFNIICGDVDPDNEICSEEP